MRGFQLARIAAQAELLRLRCALRRHAVRAVLAAFAVVFVLAALAGVHVAAVVGLTQSVTLIEALLIVVGADAVIALVLAILALRDVPGPVEREALRVRRLASEQAMETVLLATLLGSLRRVRSPRDLLAVVVAAIAALFVGARR